MAVSSAGSRGYFFFVVSFLADREECDQTAHGEGADHRSADHLDIGVEADGQAGERADTEGLEVVDCGEVDCDVVGLCDC